MPKRPAEHPADRETDAGTSVTASTAVDAVPDPAADSRVDGSPVGMGWAVVLAGIVIVGIVGAWAWTRHLPAEGDVRAALAGGHYSRAAIWLADEAEAGDPAARTALANLHYLGLGVTRDLRLAAELYYAAASEGHSPAQVNLAHLYSQGLGVPVNQIRAFGWYYYAELGNEPIAESYLHLIGTEYTLSPLQRASAVERWNRLDKLVAEGL